MNSKLTREENVQAVFDLKASYTLGLADVEILKRVARMALAAMDSEPVAVPDHLTYLQNPTLENVLSDAEENSPMSHAARILAREVKFWRSAPLYRHAQPAPASEPITVTDDMAYAFHHALTDSMIGADDVEEIKTGLRAVFANLTAPVVSAEYPDRLPCSVLLEPGLRFGKGIKTSTMLAALARRAVHESDLAALSPEERAEFQARIEDFKALIAQPAPVVPDDVLEALQKVARIRLDMNDFDGDRRGIADCLCDAEEALIEVVNRRAAMLAAAPQSPGSEPATVPGKWIPVSERMPEYGDYLVTDGRDFDVQLFDGEQFIPGFVWEDKITHWMPLPAAPQEVSHV